jgi:acyl carrier protein
MAHAWMPEKRCCLYSESDMTREELALTVRDLIAREISVPVDCIEEDSTLLNLAIDSLDVLRLAVTFEKAFKITITTAELIQIETVGDIVAGIERRLMSS